MRNLSPRQEKFCLEYISSGNATQSAIKAGYSPHTADRIGSRLLRNVEVAKRRTELQQATTTPKVANVTKRKEKLSEILDRELPEKVSAKERTLAISELNKMEGIYSEEVKQQTINILVMSEEAREITKQILGGIRTEKALQEGRGAIKQEEK